MTRTSLTHPIQIAHVKADADHGRIGITFCPGKKDASSAGGPWDRDLGVDLEAIVTWGAAAVVTLVEHDELSLLQVPALGEEVRRRYMDWIHLPIEDVSVPSDGFEAAWKVEGEGVRARLRAGFDVLVHCRGGLGRAGMVAARLLAELGMDPDRAIEAVRRVRPGAIETPAQERVVRRARPISEAQPATAPDDIKDRAIGSLLGLAVGDAVGTTLEFKTRGSFDSIDDMVGGGPFRLKPGQWTDDTSMALALAESLLDKDGIDERDLMSRFVEWRDEGRYSCTGRCFDIGLTTRAALDRWLRTAAPIAGSTDPRAAGNGSLMRLAPVAVRYWKDLESLRDAAARQSRTTHAAAEAVDACVAFAEVLADAIAGEPRSNVLRPRHQRYAGKIASIMNGSWRGKRSSDIETGGYVAHTLEAAIWCVARTADFRDAILLAANLGNDADTTAAVAGQLAGALYGAAGIPRKWVERVAWSDAIQRLAADLLRRGIAHVEPATPPFAH